MDISIIISGNLTGFSRFYASPNANDIYNEAKFDFDYRNFLTFINAGEKAYAISFSPKVIAVSLITRILDSFRRPGILVVTALIPRYQLVSGTLNAQDKSAIYRLLNEINDKFYEKNFLNGIVNQNPAVLMQDYYSDILRNYTLVSDRMQKAVNTTIEVNSPNKRIGYVSTSEKDMPKYLSSLMRKSYNGYHHVFFADKAPTNIDEPAEEIVTYHARIENGNRNVPGEVRLTDKIPTVAPEQGERPLSNTNFTYGQVLNGEAGADIIGTIENDTIVLTFRFPKEEKTVYFKFFDGANELPIHVLRPILIETNGTSMPISTDSITFYGKEIYGRKTIKSGNPEYTVESSSSIVDLQRYNNGTTINVYVSKGWTWTFDPMINNRRVNIKPISITLVNKYTGEKKYIARVTGYVTERLSGSAQEWEMQIESDYYKSATFPATGPYRLESKPQPTPANQGGSNGRNSTNVNRYGDGTRSHGNSTSNQGLKFTNGQSNEAKEAARLKEEQKKRYIKIGVFAFVVALCFVGGWWGYTKLFPPKIDDPTPDNPIIATETSATKNVSFRFIDFDGDEIKEATSEKLEISFEPSDIVSKSEDGKNYIITYDTQATPSDTVKVNVAFQNTNMLKKDFQNIFVIQSLENIVDILLSVKSSDIKLYQDIENGINKQDYNSYFDKIGKVIDRNYDYFVVLKNKLELQKPNTPMTSESKQTNPATEEPVGSTTKEKIRPGFDDAGLTLNKLKNMNPENDAEKARKQALISVLGSIENGKCPKSIEGLSRKQKTIVEQLKALNQKIEGLPSSNDDEAKYKKEKQEAFKKGLRNKSKGDNSIFTARDALKVKL